jgi:hypothetical protein
MRTTSLIPRLSALLMALLLLAGACGGGDDANDEVSADGDAEQVDDEADDNDASEGDGESKATTTTVAAGGGAASGGYGGGASGSGGSSGGGGGGGGAAAGTVQPTQPGKYHITVDGTQKVGAQSGDMPDETLEVKPPNGAVQTHVTTSDDGSSRMELELEFRGDGVYIRRISTSQQGVSKTFVFDPPALTAPASATPGQKWSWSSTSDDGKTALKGEFEVLETDARVTIGGQEISTYKLRSVITTSGDIESQSIEMQWISAEHRLIVKTEGTSSGTFGPFSFSSEYRTQLDSLTPS